VVISALMKLAGGSPSLAKELNVDAFLRQVGFHPRVLQTCASVPRFKTALPPAHLWPAVCRQRVFPTVLLALQTSRDAKRALNVQKLQSNTVPVRRRRGPTTRRQPARWATTSGAAPCAVT